MKWKTVLRDVAFIYLATFWAGFLIAFFWPSSFGINNLIRFVAMGLCIIGFTISGAIAKTERFKHLFMVALGVWILGLIDVCFFALPIKTWLLQFFYMMAYMATGGFLSFVFSPKKSVQAEGLK